MRDVRELILAQIKVVLDGITGVDSVWRNRNDLPPAKAPTLVLLDGREQKRTVTAGGGRKQQPPSVMELMPQVWIQLKQRTKVTNPLVGEELSDLRVRVLAALRKDQTLSGLQGENGELEYSGCQTDLEIGADAEGNMLLDLVLTYIFDFDDITG